MQEMAKFTISVKKKTAVCGPVVKCTRQAVDLLTELCYHLNIGS